jgi:serine/threonine protein kinase
VSMESPVPGLTVSEVLGHGGYSVVYRARQESMGREVALKVDNRTVRDERDRRRFLREANAAGQLSGHPNVISLFDAGITTDGRPYLVMEVCGGGSLADRMRQNGPLPPAEVRELGVRISDALAAAHDAGVLHRDLKPANILVNGYGSYTLSDFGLAATHDANQLVSGTVEALTPAYAPPEVFRMERPTTAVDIYGLGATLYALLSGRPPRWPADGQPSLATMMVLHDEPVPDLPGVPVALTAVLRKAMSSHPADRHGSALELRDALAAVSIETAAVTDTRPSASTTVAPVRSRRAESSYRSTGSGRVARRAASRRRRTHAVAIGLGVAVLVVGGLAGTALWSSGTTGASPTNAANRSDAGTDRAAPETIVTLPAEPSATPSPSVGDPDTITADGYGPFVVGQPADPLVASQLARTPVGAEQCDPDGQLVASDSRYTGVYAFKPAGTIGYVVIVSSAHTTRDGLKIGTPMEDVLATVPDAEELSPRDGLRYLVTNRDNGLLFVDDGEGRVGAIVVGSRAQLVEIAEGNVRPDICGI